MNRKHRSVMIQGILASVRFHPFTSACMILSIIGCIVAGLIPPLLMEQIINRIRWKYGCDGTLYPVDLHICC